MRVGGAADSGFESGAVCGNGLVVLEAAHALTFDIGRTGGGDEALLGDVLCG